MNHSRDYMSFGVIQYDPATNQTTKAGVAVAEAVDAGATPSSGEGTDAAGSATPATPATPETPTKTETEAVPSGTPETATDAANAAPAEGAAVDGQSVNEPNAATATEQSK
ncbi:MAG: hypothetical protein R3C01_15410 [Planctomycetaceae bacterium]